MRVPAAIPMLSMLAGVVVGISVGVPPALALGVVAVASWVAALRLYLTQRTPAFCAAVAISCASSAGLLAAVADREALDPPLLSIRDAQGGSGPLPIEGCLRADAWRTAGGVSLDLEVRAVGEGQGRRLTSGGVRVSVSGEMAPTRAGEWRAGRTVRMPAHLREATRYRDPGVGDARLALARRGTILVGSAKSAALVEVRARGGLADEAAAASRDAARRIVSRHVGRWSARSAAIVIAILIGDRAGLDEDDERRLQEAGTYHVIAISGGNIAILAALTIWALRLLGGGHRGSSLAAILILTGYAFIVGGGGSVVRATLMAVLLLGAALGDFKGGPLNALAVAGALVLAASPLSVFDVGCALTFGATLGILVGASKTLALVTGAGGTAPHTTASVGQTPRRAAWYVRWPLALLAASLCAELALFPVSAFAFSRVTFAGLVLNFAAIPLMTVVQVAGMLVLPAAAVHGGVASAVGWVAHVAAEGLIASADLVEWWPWLSYRLPPPHPATLVAYFGGWAAWFVLGPGWWPRLTRSQRRRRARSLALGVVVGSGVWVLLEPLTLLAPGVRGVLRVAFLDVGHADAVLLQLPDRRSVLVDAGGSLTGGAFDIGGRVVAPALWSLGTRRLDVLVLSHGDPDHIGGAASVVRDFRPREIWEGIPVPPSRPLEALRRQAEAHGIVWRTCLQGAHGTIGDVTWHVWHPPPADWERQKVRNDDSIVLELRYRDVSIVLPGDIGQPVEQDLALAIPPAPLRILKVPHHGSASSSTAAFVSALQPRIAVLSAGATTKVSDAVLRRYVAAGAALFRTDQHGAVIVTTDGETAAVTTFTGVTATFGDQSTTKDTKVTKKDGGRQ